MNHKEIRNIIYLNLARLYEKDPLQRTQYKQFTFNKDDNFKALEILNELARHNIVDQRQPGVARLTDLGYKLIKPDLEKNHLMHVIDESLNEIYMFDSETLKFVYVNGGALRNIGYSMEEMSHMTPLDIKPTFSLESFTEMTAPLKIKEKEKVVFETVHKRADGSLYPVEVHLQLTRKISKSVFVAIILDISDRKNGTLNKG